MCVESFERFNGRRSGAGKSVAILSHGFGTDQTAWNTLRPWFEARFDVISFDLAGCGPKGAQTYDFERHGSLFGYADDLLDILDELDVHNCTYIGHSMSGMIGAAAAVARPELFERLVIIGASPRYLDDAGYTGGFKPQDLEQLFESMRANYQAWIAGFAPMVVGVDDSAVVADFSNTLFQMRPDIALNTSRTIFTSDLRSLAARVSTPVHLIQTAHDIAVPVAVGEWLANAIDGATLDVIDASGHLPHMTAPNDVVDILERRLGGTAL
ncbi:alpha/beta hydrolase [Stenotrophomonas sp. TWI819]|uniref:alpha/beta fold hydrolase n=1 Tax=Stenotrophomonas sp. TWI819 TaxID=3136800 RepID=UPI0032093F3D